DQNRDAAGHLAETTTHLQALLADAPGDSDPLGAARGQIVSIADRTTRVSATADELQRLVSQFNLVSAADRAALLPTDSIPAPEAAAPPPRADERSRALVAGART